MLTNLLWPALVAGGSARVVALASTGHKLSDIRFEDTQFTTGYDKWLAYGQAKTANSLFAVQLDKLGAAHGVRAFAVHPGGIMTELQRHLPREEMIGSGWMTPDGTVNERFKSPEQGAATATWAATSPMLDGLGGGYCEDCDIAEPTVPDSPEARISGVNAHAIDPEVPHVSGRIPLSAPGLTPSPQSARQTEQTKPSAVQATSTPPRLEHLLWKWTAKEWRPSWVLAYMLLMTDEYPPFRLDGGGDIRGRYKTCRWRRRVDLDAAATNGFDNPDQRPHIGYLTPWAERQSLMSESPSGLIRDHRKQITKGRSITSGGPPLYPPGF